MRRVATPVWNACIAEREQTRLEYRQRLDEEFSDAVYDLRRDLTEKEEKAIRRRISKEIHWPTAYDQYKHIRKADHPEFERYSSSMMECTVALADSSEKSFRSLWLKGHKDARPPKQTRFLPVLTFRKSGWMLDGDKLILMGIGSLRIRLHRPVDGKIKTVTIRQTKTGKWYVYFSCEIVDLQGSCGSLSQAKPCIPQGLRQKHAPSDGSDPDLGGAHNNQVCLCRQFPDGSDPDLGGAHNDCVGPPIVRFGGSDPDFGEVEIFFPDNGFVADSRGFEIPHPEFYTAEIATLRRLSRSLSRKQKKTPNAHPNGSTKGGGEQPCLGRNRRRARRALAKWHERIASKREYFLWHVANYYARNYRRVTVWTRPAKPPIQYALTSKTARRLCDGAYAKFLNMLKQKCEQYGRMIEVKEDPEWQKQKETLTEVARLEAIQPILRKAKRAVRRNNRGRLKSLQRACARAVTVQI